MHWIPGKPAIYIVERNPPPGTLLAHEDILLLLTICAFKTRVVSGGPVFTST